jgi:two-component sensor histidine kinase
MFDAFPDNPSDPAANGVSNLRASFERAVASRRFELMDVQKYDIVRPDGTFEERWWKPANAPVVDVNGNVVAIIHHVADVTAEHRAVEALQASERHAQTLLAELQHRVRNILAMMRSVIRRTSRSKADLKDFVQHLEGRIDAMARTQALLTRVPGRDVNLEDVVRDELVAQAAKNGKAVVHGPEVGLSPHAAELVTLAIHELATNSVKYGALGNGNGHVNVSWRCVDDDGKQRLRFTWQETGLKAGASGSAGFGTELITQRVPYELNGRGEIKIADGKLTAAIEFPLEGGSSILETQPSR